MTIPTAYLDEAAKLCTYYNFNVIPYKERVDIAKLAASLHRNAILQEVSNALQENSERHS